MKKTCFIVIAMTASLAFMPAVSFAQYNFSVPVMTGGDGGGSSAAHGSSSAAQGSDQAASSGQTDSAGQMGATSASADAAGQDDAAAKAQAAAQASLPATPDMNGQLQSQLQQSIDNTNAVNAKKPVGYVLPIPRQANAKSTAIPVYTSKQIQNMQKQ